MSSYDNKMDHMWVSSRGGWGDWAKDIPLYIASIFLDGIPIFKRSSATTLEIAIIFVALNKCKGE